MRRCLPVLVLVALLSIAGACGEDQTPTVATDDAPGATTTARPATGSSEPDDADPEGFATTTVSTPPEEQGLLVSVQASPVGDVDRVTFEFEGALPGYRIGYIERPIIQDGSGDEITIDGEAVLGVHFEPASGFDLSGEGRQVYTGPDRLDLVTRTVLDVARVGDFEANLEWAIGVDTKAPFRVRTESAPNRVIIDVQTQGTTTATG